MVERSTPWRGGDWGSILQLARVSPTVSTSGNLPAGLPEIHPRPLDKGSEAQW